MINGDAESLEDQWHIEGEDFSLAATYEAKAMAELGPGYYRETLRIHGQEGAQHIVLEQYQDLGHEPNPFASDL